MKGSRSASARRLAARPIVMGSTAVAEELEFPSTRELTTRELKLHQPSSRNDEVPGEARIALQRRAPRTVRRHTVQHLARVCGIVAADVSAYLLLRSGLHSLRDLFPAGSWPNTTVSTLFPLGFLGGWSFAAALLIGLVVTGSHLASTRRKDQTKLLMASLLASALMLWGPLWTGGPGRGLVLVQLVATVFSVWIALCAGRMLVDRFLTPLWLSGSRISNALLVGRLEAIMEASGHPSLDEDGGIRILGRVPVDVVGNGNGNGARHSTLAGLQEIIHRDHVDTLIVCGNLTDEQLNAVLDAGVTGGCELLTFPRSETVANVDRQFTWRNGHPFFRLTTPELKGQHLILKRLMDVVGAGAGLILLAPLFAAIAIAIRLDSPGPAFFRQERIGLGGRRFRILKFRTMRDGADAEKSGMQHLNLTGDSRLFKIPGDPRITRVGRLLRRWSLDELPQLWNVLTGEMSLVGPRPFFASDMERYQEHHFRRLSAKPGITGLWQVEGRSSVVDFEEVVRLDREYIEQWSMPVDLKILARTVPAVIRRTGAY